MMKNEIQKRLNRIAADRARMLQAAEQRRESIRMDGVYGRQLDAILRELYGKVDKVKPDRENAFSRLAAAEEKKFTGKNPVLSTEAVESAIAFLNGTGRALVSLQKHMEALEKLAEADLPAACRRQVSVVLAGVYYTVLCEVYGNYSVQDILALISREKLQDCLRNILTGTSDRTEKNFYIILGGVLLHQRFAIEAAKTERFELLSAEGRACYRDAYKAFRFCQKKLSSLGLSRFCDHGDDDENLEAEWQILFLHHRLCHKKSGINELKSAMNYMLSHQEQNPFFVEYRKMAFRAACERAANELLDLFWLEEKVRDDGILADLYANSYKKPLAVVQGREVERRLEQFYARDVSELCGNNDPLTGKYRHLGTYYRRAGLIAGHKKILDLKIQEQQQKSGRLVKAADISDALLRETLAETLQRHKKQLDDCEKEEIRRALQENLGKQLQDYFEPFVTDRGRGLKQYKYIVKYVGRPSFNSILQECATNKDLLQRAETLLWDSIQPGVPEKLDIASLLPQIDDIFGRRYREEEASRAAKPAYAFPVAGSLILCIFISFNLAVTASAPADFQAFMINVVLQSIVLGGVSLIRNLQSKCHIYDLYVLALCVVVWGVLACLIMGSPLSSQPYNWEPEGIIRVVVAAFCEVLIYGAVWRGTGKFAGRPAK